MPGTKQKPAPESAVRGGPDELSQGKFSCVDKINPDEPVFLLRGQDLFAPGVIRYWCNIGEANGVNPEKVAEARAIADQMEQYPHRKKPD